MKSQTLKLLEHLNRGGPIHRGTALMDFGVQNITARLSELRQLGYEFIKIKTQQYLPGGRAIKATEWRLKDTFTVGDRVGIIHDIGTHISLKGRMGVIEALDLPRGQATLCVDNVGFRRLKFSALRKILHYTPGTPVMIIEGPLMVVEYHSNLDSYELASPDPKHTIIASAALVKARHD